MTALINASDVAFLLSTAHTAVVEEAREAERVKIQGGVDVGLGGFALFLLNLLVWN